MKASGRIIVVALATIVMGVLLSLPISFLFSNESKASVDGNKVANINETSTDSLNNDYIFIVLEDEQVPLASAPTQSISLNRTYAVYLSFAIAALMIAGAYSSWYCMTLTSIKRYSRLIAGSELKNLLPKKAFLHPFGLACADKEIQCMAAKKYV